jgi:outer membrane protein OmpA-like peptidoglycan-associated protein
MLTLGGLTGMAVAADATIPTRDVVGAKDSPVLKRFEGSLIVSYEREAFGQLKIPLSPLERTDKVDRRNNTQHLPKREKEVEGTRTRLVYLLPAERSPLEVLRNYEEEVKAAGGAILFTCKDTECGGDSKRASEGGGGATSLLMYFVHADQLKDAYASPGKCALTQWIEGQRFSAARIPQANGDAHVTVHAYKLVEWGGGSTCRALIGRTIAVIHVVEPKAREQKMVLVKADEMARTIASTGRVALYGIFFDFDKAEVKPESEPTLAEIAAMLKASPKLSVLIVGHTDSQGTFDYNIDLSRRRADAVVKTLVARHGIEARRLRGAGVGMQAPTASNDEEEGRAKNRRVEIVKLN